MKGCVSMTQCRFALGMITVSLFSLVGCTNESGGSKTATKEKPASVKPLPNEANLADVELTQKAYDRLGISVARATRQDVTQVRQLGGEVIVPPGESAIVVAPVSGTVEPPDNSTVPKPGSTVSKGQVVFEFRPLLTPERFVPTPAERAQIANAQATLISLQMTADGDVQQFTEQVTAAQIALKRAEQLRRDRVGSERAVDDAKAQLALAEAGLKASLERKSELDLLTSDIEKGIVTSLTIDSPIDGIVRNLPVTLGQTVSAGTTLFEVVNLEVVWIRVPVYVGLLEELKLNEQITVMFFGDGGQQAKYIATAVMAPPAADPLSSTADLIYSIDNTSGRFRPGERVSVTIPMTTATESMVVPVNALLYDIYGSTWVYQKIDDLHFRRLRVMVQRTTDTLAIIKSGISEGTEVVVDGSAELFGTEFGTGK